MTVQKRKKMLDIKKEWLKFRQNILPASKNDIGWRFDAVLQILSDHMTKLNSLSDRIQVMEDYNFKNNQQIDRISNYISHADTNKHDKFVRQAYRAILKREADSEGLEHFIQAIENNHIDYYDVITSLMSGYEYIYAPERDPQFKNFNDQEIKDRTQKIINHLPFSIEELDGAVPEFHGIDYYEVHKRRFLELVNYLSYCQSTVSKTINVLECGSTLSTKLIKSLLPEVALSISDFKPLPEIEAASTFPMKELIKEHYQVDFMRDDLDATSLKESPRFDVILLCEVIEHLLVNPHKVIRFLLRHLTDDGQLYITTPNIFQHSYVTAFKNKVNPLALYPEEYSLNDSPHFHLREYGMGELLNICENCGASIEAFYFSSCWDTQELIDKIPNHELSNLVIVVRKKQKK